MQPFETIYIDSLVAACNGGGGPLGHPKVYLNLSAAGQVECPYCSRLFIHQARRVGADAAEGHSVEAPASVAPPAARGTDRPPAADKTAAAKP